MDGGSIDSLEMADAAMERSTLRRPHGPPSIDAAISRLTRRSLAGAFVPARMLGSALLVAGCVTAVCAADPAARSVAPRVLENATPLAVIFGGMSALFWLLWVGLRLPAGLAVLRGPGQPIVVRAVGYHPPTREWLVETLDGSTRLTVDLARGRGLLVAGDLLVAIRLLRWERFGRSGSPIRTGIALTGSFGTVWGSSARHCPDPAEPEDADVGADPWRSR